MNKKVIKNFVTGILSQAIILVLGFVIPRIILTHYGSDTNGLINTITQIFTYMALLEAGISQASTNALYKHIINNDKKEISVVVSASRRYYRRISFFYLIAVIVLSIVVPFIIKTEIDYWTIFFFIIFEGLTSVVAFYFINTWTCFLAANGKSYITNSITLFNKILCYGVRIVLALYNINIAFIQVGYFAVSLIQLMVYYIYMRKKYSWIDYKAAPKDYKLPNRNSYLVAEIAWTVFSSTDLIILSIFVSTSLSSVYSTYNMVFVSLNGILSNVYNALKYSLGQVYHEDLEKYKKLHNLFNSVFVGAMTALMCTAYWLIIPFVSLYTEGVYDINYIYTALPLMFCLVQMLSWSCMVAGSLINIAGRVKRAMKVYIAEAVTNLILSVILVQFYDIIGVIIATVVALPLKLIYCNYVADVIIMKRKVFRTISIIGGNAIVFAAAVMIYPFVELKIDSYLLFLGYGAALFLLFATIVVTVNALINRDILKTFRLIKH